MVEGPFDDGGCGVADLSEAWELLEVLRGRKLLRPALIRRRRVKRVEVAVYTMVDGYLAGRVPTDSGWPDGARMKSTPAPRRRLEPVDALVVGVHLAGELDELGVDAGFGGGDGVVDLDQLFEDLGE